MDIPQTGCSRRTFMRGAVWSVPVLGALASLPVASATPPECGDPNGLLDNCATELPQQFSSTSFSTTPLISGTNYSILFSTLIRRGPLIPSGATGYRINTLSVSGNRLDGTPFHLTPGIGERGPRVLGAPSGSSLGFALDVPWNPAHLVRSFIYAYEVQFLNGLTGIQTCPYTTTMTLADNGFVAGGVGSVTFSPPRLTACDVPPPVTPQPPAPPQ